MSGALRFSQFGTNFGTNFSARKSDRGELFPVDRARRFGYGTESLLEPLCFLTDWRAFTITGGLLAGADCYHEPWRRRTPTPAHCIRTMLEERRKSHSTRCNRADDGVCPGEQCIPPCGLYAYKSKDDYMASIYAFRAGVIAGEVELDGKIIDYPDADRPTWRAERARILRLVLYDVEIRSTAKRMARKYGVPLQVKLANSEDSLV